MVQLLSDPASRAHKFRLLVVVMILAQLVVAWQCFAHSPRYSIYTMVFLVIALAAAVLFAVWRQVGYLADEVFEEGAGLVARRNGAESMVKFEDIADVRVVNASTREAIEVQLRTRVMPFGARIVFWPPNWKSISSEEMEALAAKLKSRFVRHNAA